VTGFGGITVDLGCHTPRWQSRTVTVITPRTLETQHA